MDNLTMSTKIENVITEKVRVLSEEEQQEVLEFIEKLTNKALRRKSSRLSFIGISKSGKKNLSTQAETILEQAADKREGWNLI